MCVWTLTILWQASRFVSTARFLPFATLLPRSYSLFTVVGADAITTIAATMTIAVAATMTMTTVAVATAAATDSYRSVTNEKRQYIRFEPDVLSYFFEWGRDV